MDVVSAQDIGHWDLTQDDFCCLKEWNEGRERELAMRLPFVMFLDIDRTCIGNATSLAGHYCLSQVVKELDDRRSMAHRIAPVPASYRNDIVRPGLGKSFREVRKSLRAVDGHDSLEIFVCSLGQRGLVTECKVPLIEDVAGIKFNRPLFCVSTTADENCQAFADGRKKLVRKCFDVAMRALVRKRKWRHLANDVEQWSTYLHSRRFLMVDDTPSVAYDAASNRKLVVCPPFDRCPVFDVLSCFPKRVRENANVIAYVEQNPKFFSQDTRKDMGMDSFWPAFAGAFRHAARARTL